MISKVLCPTLYHPVAPFSNTTIELTPQTSHPVLHVHVEKTGGTSVSMGLADVPNSFTDGYRFGGLFLRDFVDIFQQTERPGMARIQLCQNHSLSEKAVAWIRFRGQQQQSDVDGCFVFLIPTPSVISAHPSVVPGTIEWKQSWAILRRWYPYPVTATVLRRPDARTESHWHHFDRGELRHPHELAIDEWISYCKMMGSLYVGRFSTIPLELSPTESPAHFLQVNQAAVDSAVSVLRNSFDIVSRTECLEEFVLHAKSLVTTSPSSSRTYRTNVAQNKVTQKPLEGEHLRALRSPLDGGYVLDHLVFDALFGEDYTCSTGSDASAGIRLRLEW